jgi:hypothetical protein
LKRNFLGGELWHYIFSSRARFLEHSLALERKIADSEPPTEGTTYRLVFCGSAFHWTRDRLEDFADFYRTGRWRADDALAAQQAHYIASKGISFRGTINGFCCLHRDPASLTDEFRVDVRGPWFGA